MCKHGSGCAGAIRTDSQRYIQCTGGTPHTHTCNTKRQWVSRVRGGRVTLYWVRQPPAPGGASRALALLTGAAATPRRFRRQRNDSMRARAAYGERRNDDVSDESLPSGIIYVWEWNPLARQRVDTHNRLGNEITDKTSRPSTRQARCGAHTQGTVTAHTYSCVGDGSAGTPQTLGDGAQTRPHRRLDVAPIYRLAPHLPCTRPYQCMPSYACGMLLTVYSD